MPQTIELKLTVYQPGTIAGPGQEVGFEYDLTIEVPDLTSGRQSAAWAASAGEDIISRCLSRYSQVLIHRLPGGIR